MRCVTRTVYKRFCNRCIPRTEGAISGVEVEKCCQDGNCDTSLKYPQQAGGLWEGAVNAPPPHLPEIPGNRYMLYFSHGRSLSEPIFFII